MKSILDAMHLVNQPKVKVGDKVKAVKGGDFSGTVEKVKKDGSVSFRHSDGKLYRTHHTNVRVVKEEVEQTDEAIKPKSKEDEGEYGYEGDMAMSQLRSIIRNSQAMLDNLEPETDLPEWVQSKITLAKDYIETSANYLMSELEEATGPGFMLLPGAKRTPTSYRGSKTTASGVVGKQQEKPEEQKPAQTVVSRGKVFKEAMYSGPERRDTSPEGETRRMFVGRLRQRAMQRKQEQEEQKPKEVNEKRSVVHASGRQNNPKDEMNTTDPRRALHPSKGRYPQRSSPQPGAGYMKNVKGQEVLTKLNSGDYVSNFADMILEKKRAPKKANNVTNMEPELNTSGTNLNTTPTMDASAPEPGRQ